MSEPQIDTAPNRQSDLYPCPCCGYFMFSGVPDTYEICEMCGWEDNQVQLVFPFDASGPNGVCLYDMQRNFMRSGPLKGRGGAERGLTEFVRDPTWRPFDPKVDPYPSSVQDDELWRSKRDDSGLYYWRDDYWLLPRNRPA